MPGGRFTIAALLGIVLFCGAIFAGLRSGSNDAFKTIYTLTFLILVYAGIAARYLGPFWHGFAVAGWAYFLIGFGPWIDLPGSEPLRAVNRNIVSSVVLEIVSGTMSASEPPPPMAGLPNPWMMMSQMRQANRDGITHSALTILFAIGGGFVSRRLARLSLNK